MAIYSLFVYDRNGQCLIYRSWHQKHVSPKALVNKQKLVFGLVYSLKAFCNKINPKKLDELEQTPIQTITTPDYRIHYYETMTGLRFVLTTDPATQFVGEMLKHIYTFYANFIARNPSNEPGCIPEDTSTFLRRVDYVIENHANFSTGLPAASTSEE